NIGLPSRTQYQRRLIEKTESVIQRMRWKAHFFLGKQTTNCDEQFGLPSPNNAPMVTQLKHFEDDVIKMISNIQFRTVNDPFMNKISKDLDRINSSNNILVFADKSTKNL
ncbi:Hypothetical predicted protein, partial [Paramuricea clavata]